MRQLSFMVDDIKDFYSFVQSSCHSLDIQEQGIHQSRVDDPSRVEMMI